MTTVLRLEAGRLGATMKRRAAQLGRLSLGSSLLRPSLWTRKRPRVRYLASQDVALTGAEPTLGSAAVYPLARRGSAHRLTPTSRRMAGKPLASMRATAPGVRKPILQSTIRLSRSRSADETTSAAAPILQIRLASRRAGQSDRSVTQPILLAGGAPVRPSSAAGGASGAREPSLRAPAIRTIANGMAQQRPALGSVPTGQRSRPASNLAAQVNRKSEQQPKSGSESRDRGLMDSLLPPSTSRLGGGERGRAGRSDGGQSNDGKVSLSGDFVVNGRRLGELALSSAAKGGASAQTGARNPNFRRNALPSGLSTPLP